MTEIEEDFVQMYHSGVNSFGTGTVVVAESDEGEKVQFSVAGFSNLTDRIAQASIVDLNGGTSLEVPIETLLKGGVVVCSGKEVSFPRRSAIPRCFLNNIR